jgi:hypothetical protein
MTPAQRSRFESLAIEWGAAFDIGPDQVRALDDRRLTDLCRCFAVVAENKRKVAHLLRRSRRTFQHSPRLPSAARIQVEESFLAGR